MKALLSHIHSIVCDNDIGGLFLGCFKSCKMAAHNLKIHFNSLFMIQHRKVSKMFRRVSYWLKKYVLWFKPMSFCNHWLNQHAFFVLKGVTPTFSNLGILLKIDIKNVLCWGNCCQFGEQFQYCPNQPFLPNLPRWLKTHLAFSMFPILDTNLWC